MKRNLLGPFAFILCLTALFVFAGSASAQNMSGTVVTKQVKFAKGKHSATISGRAKYGMSYVYKLGGRVGQTMDVSMIAGNRELKFSIIGPDDETMEGAFLVSEWSGKLPATGKYSIVVVMNDKEGGIVSYSLSAGIK